ncbi:MAG: T9SS type A sorting domain-containing protein [Bacteroidetes bacterium]|nr:T9SS type A sorting domain-containing protein [Bacteroidota bacterium]
MMLISSLIYSQQNKRNNVWAVGYQPVVKFNFDNGLIIDTVTNAGVFNPPFCLIKSSSSTISDTNGNLLFFSNGFVIYDSAGFAMPDGLYVNCPYGQVLANYYGGASLFDQTSIILPKKGNTYYVFSTGMSDSVANNYVNHVYTEFDVLNYSVVDMDSNAGMGKVVQKNVVLADKQHYHWTPLSAVKHSNGKDWWLVKADCSNDRYQLFWVQEDTILGPYYQYITTKGDFCTAVSQLYFSEDGTQMVCSQYGNIYGNGGNTFYYYNRVELYDFDRCDGTITYKKHYIIPYDTSTYVNYDFKRGICFSPNGKLLYMSTNYSVFQIDLEDTNTYNALYIHGPDTSDFMYFPLYGTMVVAPDGKLYIGNHNGTRKFMSYIDSPNVKGLGCHFVPQGVWQPYSNLMSPPNMPNYGLGADTVLCWPLGSIEIRDESLETLEVYPNPSSTYIVVRYEMRDKRNATIEMYNAIGQQVYSSQLSHLSAYISIDVRHLAKGMYYLRCGNEVRKTIIE